MTVKLREGAVEPDEERLPRPTNGWPSSSMRVDLDKGLTPNAAATELAGASRRFKMGASGMFRGSLMVAYPSETAVDVADRWRALDIRNRGQQQAGKLPAAGTTRWTPERKLAVLVAIGGERITKEDALRTWHIGPDELAEWSTRYEMFGLDGLSAINTKALRAR